MCTEAEAREQWSLDDILEEERDRRDAEERKRAEPGGIIQRNKRTSECVLDNNADVDVMNCFLCQEQMKYYRKNTPSLSPKTPQALPQPSTNKFKIPVHQKGQSIVMLNIKLTKYVDSTSTLTSLSLCLNSTTVRLSVSQSL